MGVKEDIMEALDKWVAKIDDPNIKEKFKGFNKTLNSIFPINPLMY
jgi:hypothetical protein